MSLAPEPTSIASFYRDKPIEYFGGARTDLVERLKTGPDGAILELGCGSGGTGRAVIAAGKAGRYVGIELDPAAASIAAGALSEVIVGDIGQLDLTPLRDSFDAVIVSEVLEHLTDPWSVLGDLVRCLKPGGVIFGSSPNIAHWYVVKKLFLGRFDYEESGHMDRTHLRWFTPKSFRALFEDAGVEVLSLEAHTPPGWKAALVDKITGGRLHHLFVTQMVVTGRRRGA